MTNRATVGLCILVLLLFASGSLGATTDDRLVLSDIFELEMASDPRISPDGESVVYVRNFADVMTDQRYSNLWLVAADGSGHRPLTTGSSSDSLPRWSPDGERLAFVSDREGTPQIYVRWMDSGQTAKISHLQTPPSTLAWSPDGEWLAFTALVPEPPPQIASDLPQPPPGAEWAEPAKVIDKLVYRFDQVGFLPPGYSHVFVIPAEGGTPRQITSGDFHHGGPGLRRDSAPVFLPDGKSILLSANRRSDWELEPLESEIWEFPLDGSPPRALTDRRGPDNAPAVSPDGSRIAYVGHDDRYQGYQLTQLYVMNRDGSKPRVVSGKLDRSVSSPVWSADSRSVYFLYDHQGMARLARTSLDGRIETVDDQVGGGGSAYTGGSFTLAPDGTYAATYSDPHTPGDVAVGSGGERRLVTAVNEDLLAAKELGQLEEIWYESSHDQRRIHGWIIKPPGFDPTRNYPLVLEIHGGPFAAYGPSFDLEKQLMAAAGYVVLYTNPRGSTSYGEEFGNLIHHAYPGDDFYDLMSGVDAVLAKGYVDPEQLYVTGGSGGGVLTSWVIGRSDRFRAAVTVYPVINWYSWVLSADISSFGVKYWFPGLPWDHVEHYESRSLLSVVENVTTPTMVLCGEEDYRTPMSESEQYYQALKLLEVEAVLVRIPGEPHGTRRRPSHHVQKVGNIIGWFDRHRGSKEETMPTGGSP